MDTKASGEKPTFLLPAKKKGTMQHWSGSILHFPRLYHFHFLNSFFFLCIFHAFLSVRGEKCREIRAEKKEWSYSTRTTYRHQLFRVRPNFIFGVLFPFFPELLFAIFALDVSNGFFDQRSEYTFRKSTKSWSSQKLKKGKWFAKIISSTKFFSGRWTLPLVYFP